MTTDWYDPSEPTQEQVLAWLRQRVNIIDDALINLHTSGSGQDDALRTLAGRLDKLEQLPRTIEHLTVETVILQPDDILIIRPASIHLTPNQTNDLQDHLRTWMPDRKLVVLPIPAEITVTRNALP